MVTPLNQSRWHAGCRFTRRHVVSHYCPSADCGSITNCDTLQNDRARANKDVLPEHSWTSYKRLIQDALPERGH